MPQHQLPPSIHYLPNIQLDDQEFALLEKCFSDRSSVHIVNEFTDGRSGARVLLASLGHNQALLIVKIGVGSEIAEEFDAYKTYVEESAPQTAARIERNPAYLDGPYNTQSEKGIIVYTFVGVNSHTPAISLARYFRKHQGQSTAKVLTQFFERGQQWWMMRRPEEHVPGKLYDHLLPEHLHLNVSPSRAETAQRLESGRVGLAFLRDLQVDQQVRLINFSIAKIDYSENSLTLTAPAPQNELSAPLRLRLFVSDVTQYAVEEPLQSIDAIVATTRAGLMQSYISALFPTYNPDCITFIPEQFVDAQSMHSTIPRNPLSQLHVILDTPRLLSMSTIHGDLNLQNLLIDEPTGYTWMIDFAKTGYGPTLYDFQRLEVQVITKLLPAAIEDAHLEFSVVLQLMETLHAEYIPISCHESALQEIFLLMRCIRSIASHYLVSANKWDDYYAGLIIMLLGTYKYSELTLTARQLACMVAGIVKGLMGVEVSSQSLEDLGKGAIEDSLTDATLSKLEQAETVKSGGFVGRVHVNFSKNERFQGRVKELADLHDLLQKNVATDNNPSQHTCIAVGVTGMGGIGKTQLVVEYAYRYWADYPGGVFLINAAENIQPQLVDVATRLNLTVSDPGRPDINEQLLTSLSDHLQLLPQTLLIFDNVAEPELLLRHTFGPGLTLNSLGGSLLITTRQRQLPSNILSFPLSTLENDLNAARSIITVVRPDLADDEKLNQLCKRMGYLPLGLSLAASVLSEIDDLTSEEYLLELERIGLDALNTEAGVSPSLYYDYTSLTPVFQRQWEQLQQDIHIATNANEIFQIASHLGEAVMIPVARLSLMSGIVDTSRISRPLTKALERLKNLYLIEQLEDDAIRLHPLMREFAETLTPQENLLAVYKRWAINLADAYTDFQRLVNECARRGIVEMQEDILTTLELFKKPVIVGYSNDELAICEPIIARLTALYQLLQREAHSLYGNLSHARIIQQLAYRVLDLEFQPLLEEVSVVLNCSVSPRFLCKWAERTESSALERNLVGHEDWVRSVTIFAGGLKAISASSDCTLKVWSLETGKTELTLAGHDGEVWSVAVFDDGRKAISASSDCTLKIWNLETGKTEQTLAGHDGEVWSVAVLDNGRKAVSASSDQTVKVWNLFTGEVEKTLIGHKDVVRSVGAFCGGRKAISASYDHTLKVWDLAIGKLDKTLTGHTNLVRAVAVYDDGHKAISASSDCTLKIWDLATGNAEKTLIGHTDLVRSVAVYDNGCRAISTSSDHTLKVWNLVSGEVEQTLYGHGGSIWSVGVFDNGSTAVSTSYDRTLKVWNLVPKQAKQPVVGHINWVRSIITNAHRSQAISASDDKTLKIWDLETGKLVRTLSGHEGPVMSAAVCGGGDKIISASDDKTLKIWNLDTGKVEQTLIGHRGGVRFVTVFESGSKAISASDDRTLKVWNLKTGEEEQTLTGHESEVRSVFIYDEERKAISASANGTLNIWDLKTGEVKHTLISHERGVRSVAVYKKGHKSVSASDDGTLKIWNLKTNTVVNTLRGHNGPVWSVAVIENGCKAISASEDRTLKVWNLDTGDEITSIELDSAILHLTVQQMDDHLTVMAGDAAGAVYCLEYVESSLFRAA